ncbi:MAG: fimbrillin family protein [Muribaculaceae bacterium]|nr:fimbrillin family protein [Muribaculaceae bacterium]
MAYTSKYILASAFALLILSGCSDNDSQPVVPTAKDYPDFSATIGDRKTRAIDSQWESDDMIGISGAGRTNVAYITNDGLGNFRVQTSGTQIYFPDDSETTFTAYYPWSSLNGTSVISTDTRNQTNRKSFDFLWATASGQKDAPNVNFTFDHRMVKVVLTVSPGTGMTYDEIKNFTMSLTGVRHNGSFNIADGTTTVDDESESWTFSDLAILNDAERTMTFSFILFPQVFDKPLDFLALLDMPGNNDLTLKAYIDFTGANRQKDGTAAKNEWVAGRQYNLSLTLNKTDINVAECLIKDWDEVKGDEIIVD